MPGGADDMIYLKNFSKCNPISKKSKCLKVTSNYLKFVHKIVKGKMQLSLKFQYFNHFQAKYRYRIITLKFSV